MSTFDYADEGADDSPWWRGPDVCSSDGMGAYADVPDQTSNLPANEQSWRASLGVMTDAVNESAHLYSVEDHALDICPDNREYDEKLQAFQEGKKTDAEKDAFEGDNADSGRRLYEQCIDLKARRAAKDCKNGVSPIGPLPDVNPDETNPRLPKTQAEQQTECKREWAKGMAELRTDTRLEHQGSQYTSEDSTLGVDVKGVSDASGRLGLGTRSELKEMATEGQYRNQITSRAFPGYETICADMQRNAEDEADAAYMTAHTPSR